MFSRPFCNASAFFPCVTALNECPCVLIRIEKRMQYLHGFPLLCFPHFCPRCLQNTASKPSCDLWLFVLIRIPCTHHPVVSSLVFLLLFLLVFLVLFSDTHDDGGFINPHARKATRHRTLL